MPAPLQHILKLKKMNTETLKSEKPKPFASDGALKPKEAVKEVANLNNQVLEQTPATGKKIVEEAKQAVPLKQNTELFLDIYDTSLNKSIKLTEETATGMVDGYKKRMELYDNFNTKLMDSVKEMASAMSPLDMDKVLKLIKDNFDLSKHIVTEGMKAVIETYNKHMDVALGCNQTFSDAMIAQFKMFKDMNEKSVSFYNNLSTEWWKEHDMK
jgi:hypothetical protein